MSWATTLGNGITATLTGRSSAVVVDPLQGWPGPTSHIGSPPPGPIQGPLTVDDWRYNIEVNDWRALKGMDGFTPTDAATLNLALDHSVFAAARTCGFCQLSDTATECSKSPNLPPKLLADPGLYAQTWCQTMVVVARDQSVPTERVYSKTRDLMMTSTFAVTFAAASWLPIKIAAVAGFSGPGLLAVGAIEVFATAAAFLKRNDYLQALARNSIVVDRIGHIGDMMTNPMSLAMMAMAYTDRQWYDHSNGGARPVVGRMVVAIAGGASSELMAAREVTKFELGRTDRDALTSLVDGLVMWGEDDLRTLKTTAMAIDTAIQVGLGIQSARSLEAKVGVVMAGAEHVATVLTPHVVVNGSVADQVALASATIDVAREIPRVAHDTVVLAGMLWSTIQGLIALGGAILERGPKTREAIGVIKGKTLETDDGGGRVANAVSLGVALDQFMDESDADSEGELCDMPVIAASILYVARAVSVTMARRCISSLLAYFVTLAQGDMSSEMRRAVELGIFDAIQHPMRLITTPVTPPTRGGDQFTRLTLTALQRATKKRREARRAANVLAMMAGVVM